MNQNYVYRIELEITDRKETVFYGSYSYESTVIEHHILRYELFAFGKRKYIHGFHYESALLAKEPTFEGLVWQWNREREAPETLCFLKRNSKLGGLVLDEFASKRVWGFTAKPHFSQRVIENQWRREREKAEQEKAEAEARKSAEESFFKGFLNGIHEVFEGPRSKALNLLGLPIGASGADIKQAYRKLATVHHPDMGGDRRSFVEIQDAYELLIGATCSQ